MTTSRRAFLLGAASLLAAPAVVKASSLMPLWVPPKPVFAPIVVNLEGYLYEGKTIVGKWAQKNGRVRWEYVNPVQQDPSNGIYNMSYQGPVARTDYSLKSVPGVSLWPV